MPAWTVSDGTVIALGRGRLVVTGSTTFAASIRSAAVQRPWVDVAGQPDGTVPFDPRSAFLVDTLVRHRAASEGLAVTCNQVIQVPHEIARMRKQLGARVPGRIY